ncbi:MAG: hypothetical protein PGN30_10110 [Mycolicibacterium neoaurum]|uniref:hypothetical protein n=1 Tax=Mycolicibacterium neoaurum TaxID=1795 RepID=UPI002FF94837
MQGERVRETDTGREKTGDGINHYNDLLYDDVVLLSRDPAAARKALGIDITSTGTDQTAEINAALAAIAGTMGTVKLRGAFTITAPLIMYSKSALDASDAVVTLGAGRNCNMLRNASSVAPVRSVTDMVATNGSASVISASAAFTSADVGRSLVIADAGGDGYGPLVGIILSVTNATTVVLDEKATNTVSGKSGKLYNRDSYITVRGGWWDRAANMGTLTDRHSLLFRHIDHLDVDIDNYTSTDGKYGVAPGDVRWFHCAVRDSNTSSCPLQINGPARNGHIEYVGGITHDNMLAFTAADYPAYQDVAGDIVGMTIGNLKADIATGILRILAGHGRFVGDFKVMGQIRGRSTIHAVELYDDDGYPNTSGGTYGSFDFGTIDVTCTTPESSDLSVACSTSVESVTARVIHGPEKTNLVPIVVTGDHPVTIKSLNLVDCTFRNALQSYGIVVGNAAATISKLNIVRPVFESKGSLLNLSLGTVEDAVLDGGKWSITTVSQAAVILAGAVVGSLRLMDCYGTYSSATGATYGIVQNTATSTAKISIIRGRHANASEPGGGSTTMLRNLSPSIFNGTLVLDQCALVGVARVSTLIGAPTIVLAQPLLDSVTVGAFHITTGPMVVTGEMRTAGSFPLLQRAGSEAVRVNSRTLALDTALLTPGAGDMVTNTNAALPHGAGVVVYDGTKWVNLYSGQKPADVQVFTANGTWTKPAGAVSVNVRVIGPGGGGAAGARGPSGTALAGGGAGGSGGMSQSVFAAADLPATVSIGVGTGGAGAAGQTNDGTAGANGTQGSGGTQFGSYLLAGRGSGGTGGGLAAGGNGGASGSGMWAGGTGGSGSAAGAAGGSGGFAAGPGAGGAGGGITAAGVANAGGTGGASNPSPAAAGTAGNGANGGPGSSSAVKAQGTGGGGGAASVTGNGYNGGAAGNYGAGGAGGGAALNGNTSGAGTNGGDGICVVTTYF